MTFSLADLAFFTVLGFCFGMITVILWGLYLSYKRKRQQDMDNACNELERGQ